MDQCQNLLWNAALIKREIWREHKGVCSESGPFSTGAQRKNQSDFLKPCRVAAAHRLAQALTDPFAAACWHLAGLDGAGNLKASHSSRSLVALLKSKALCWSTGISARSCSSPCCLVQLASGFGKNNTGCVWKLLSCCLLQTLRRCNLVGIQRLWGFFLCVYWSGRAVGEIAWGCARVLLRLPGGRVLSAAVQLLGSQKLRIPPGARVLAGEWCWLPLHLDSCVCGLVRAKVAEGMGWMLLLVSPVLTRSDKDISDVLVVWGWVLMPDFLLMKKALCFWPMSRAYTWLCLHVCLWYHYRTITILEVFPIAFLIISLL